MASALKAVQIRNKTIVELDPSVHKDAIVWLGGIVISWRTVVTKAKGQEMGFGVLMTEPARSSLWFFFRMWSKNLLKVDSVLLIKGS